MLNWFREKSIAQERVLPFIDIHSHLLPKLDDGVQTFEDSEAIILQFQKLGYQKLITTPHVMSDFFKNSNEDILGRCNELKSWLAAKNIKMEIQASAEYYLDEELFRKVENDRPMLTFGDKFLLFETNFMTEPLNLKEFIFMATIKGYKLVLAHPERYQYIQNNFSKAEDLLNRGVYFQLNISSISGYYSKGAQTIAHKLIEKGWVHLVGSDCHNLQQIQLLEETRNAKYFQKVISLPLLNNSL